MSNLNFVLETLEYDESSDVVALSALPHKDIIDTIFDEAEKFNAKLPEARRVPASTVEEIISREKTHPNALRALGQYFNTVENINTPTPTVHLDLLPANHPLSTKWISQATARQEISQYFSSDTRIADDETRGLIASALSYEPDSAQRFFYNEVFLAKEGGLSAIALLDEADRLIEDRRGTE